MTTVAHPAARGHRTLRLPLSETDDERFLTDRAFAKTQLDPLYRAHPELFPDQFEKGYAFYGYTPVSCKQQLRCRRLRLRASGVVYTVAPGFMMPYMSAPVAEVENALLLMRFHVPCWVIAQVFGRNAMYGYRLQQGLGRLSVVGTTVKTAEPLPRDWVADEKHSRCNGEKLYIATTAGAGCILGAAVSDSASEVQLSEAYGVFAQEAQALDSDDQPETVNTDGWQATQAAWRTLFPTVTVILCFLHAYLKVRDRATQALAEWFSQVGDKIWHAYRATTQRAFAQRLRRLQEWAEQNLPDSPMKTHTLDLCHKRKPFIQSYDYPNAHRTSHLVDRLMRFMDRAFFNAQYFHGTRVAAEQRVRALALLWNFCPSSPQTIKKHQGQRCPAERLNAKRYAESWLENLLVSGSMNGVRNHQQNPL